MVAKLKAPARPPNSTFAPASVPTIVSSYRKEAAEDAWKRMTDWFKKYKFCPDHALRLPSLREGHFLLLANSCIAIHFDAIS